MDSILCDELVQEIFRRLPPSSYSAVSLVSKKWLRLFRSSTVALSLCFSNPVDLPSLSNFLSQHSFLSSLSVTTAATAVVSPDFLLSSIVSSYPDLRQLCFFSDPVSLFSLFYLSTSCPRLSSLSITVSRPLVFDWLAGLRFLKDLSILITGNSTSTSTESQSLEFNFPSNNPLTENLDSNLNLESLCLSGGKIGDYGLNWLWNNCNNVRRLKLKSCEGVGDSASFSAFIKRCKGLEEVELRTCRTIMDGVLLKLAENCVSLTSLLVYDGGSKEGLHQFIANSNRCELQKLDLRLPLDLDNSHLVAIAENLRCLTTLRLQSCCLVTGEGLRSLGRAMDDRLEELALVNCDTIEREPGLLATLGQSLKRLLRLELSYNEMLPDKELTSMLVSCSNLMELRLRGCHRLTNAAMVCLSKNCKELKVLDIMFCSQIGSEAVELFLMNNSSHLRKLLVEETKLSVAATTMASNKSIELVP